MRALTLLAALVLGPSLALSCAGGSATPASPPMSGSAAILPSPASAEMVPREDAGNNVSAPLTQVDAAKP
jgi:hypothetical protein